MNFYIIYLLVSFIHSSYGFSIPVPSIVSKVISPLFEVCDTRWVTQDIEGLEEDLQKHVFGQELAVGIILTALRSYLSKSAHKKPLVLSFHGWTGGGKTFIKDFIVKHWFSKADKSKFIKFYFAEKHFPSNDATNIHNYKEQLHRDFEETIALCSRAMFVFDEVDKYPAHVLDAVKLYLDYNSNIDGHDYREAIFIFISNSGGELITQVALKKWQQGVNRGRMRMQDFEKPLITSLFNDEGGFYRSDLIKHHLIDYIVPFLPLEKSHVHSCIQAVLEDKQKDLNAVGITDKDLSQAISELMEEIVFEPAEHPLYAPRGCHNLEPMVNTKVEELRRKKMRENYSWRMKNEL